jgi:hypothetical protein
MLMSEMVTRLDAGNFDADRLQAVAQLLCCVWPKPGRTVATRCEAMTAEFMSYDGPASRVPRVLRSLRMRRRSPMPICCRVRSAPIAAWRSLPDWRGCALRPTRGDGVWGRLWCVPRSPE